MMGPIQFIGRLKEINLAPHTIFIMQFFYLEGVVTLANYIVVELVPQSRSRELGAGEFGQRAEINAIYSLSDKGEEQTQQTS